VQGRTDPGAETVLLSAGLGGAGGFWQPQLAALTERFRVILYDQRGTGANRMPLPNEYSIHAMAADVVEILDASGTARCHFVGHALGGIVGLALALRAPERLASLVLVNAWARADSQTARCFAVRKELLLHAGPEAYVRAQPLFLYPAPWLSQNAERLARDDAHGIATFQGSDTLLKRIGALLAFDVSDRLGEIRVPTLVAASRDDLLVPWTCSEALAAGLPDAKLWVVPEGGHGFTVIEPDAFNAKLLAFLSDHAAG
jgi:aminoacrylate hydrolase